jgi:hypothetical protein
VAVSAVKLPVAQERSKFVVRVRGPTTTEPAAVFAPVQPEDAVHAAASLSQESVALWPEATTA